MKIPSTEEVTYIQHTEKFRTKFLLMAVSFLYISFMMGYMVMLDQVKGRKRQTFEYISP